MTLGALRRETGRNMIRRFRSGKIIPVAANAIGWCACILVPSGIRMARFATERRVPAEKREPRPLVLLHHICDLPGLRGVAAQAICAKLGLVHICVTR